MMNLASLARTAALASASVLAFTAAACPRSAAPSAEAAGGDLSGSWIHREMPVRYLESMTLRMRRDSVLGDGTFTMEAGRTGKTSIVGRSQPGGVTLDILRDTGVRERWTGTLHGDTLAGTLTIDGNAQPFIYIRQP
jgi:hypothetical protein